MDPDSATHASTNAPTETDDAPDLSTSVPKIRRRRPLSTTIDGGAARNFAPVVAKPQQADADKKVLLQKRRSESYDRKVEPLQAKEPHSSASSGKGSKAEKAISTDDIHRKEKLRANRKSLGYTKRSFFFDDMESVLDNCSFDFNSSTAMLMVRSPKPPRMAPGTSEQLRLPLSEKASGGRRIPSSDGEESGGSSITSPTSRHSAGISFDPHAAGLDAEVHTAGSIKQKASRDTSPKQSNGKEAPERTSAEPAADQPTTAAGAIEADAEEGEVVATVEEDSGATIECRGLLFNFRDLCQATHQGVVPGLVFRSAALTRAEVHPLDLHRVLVFLRKGLNIKTIIDLRAKDEKLGDKLDWLVEKVYPTIKDPTVTGVDDVKRFNISFLNRDVKLKGLFWPCPRSTKFKMVRNIFNKEEMTKVFARDVMNTLGLAGLNKLMIIYSHAEIVRALRVISDLRNHPVMIHCASGKDRTGLICALVLACCGVSDHEIVQNYQESEKYLGPVMDRIQEENALKGLDSSFDGTPREVMQETLAFIKEKWGSIAEYLDEIGFSLEEQRQLAAVLVQRTAKRAQPSSSQRHSSSKIGRQRVGGGEGGGGNQHSSAERAAVADEDPAVPQPPLAPEQQRPRSLSGTMGPQGLVSAEFYSILSQGCEEMFSQQVRQAESVL